MVGWKGRKTKFSQDFQHMSKLKSQGSEGKRERKRIKRRVGLSSTTVVKQLAVFLRKESAE
jgi:hypothetical protein